jgi:hypothetical protein
MVLKCINNTDLEPTNRRYDPNRPICKSKEEINEYIKDIEVQHWVVE